MKMSSLPYLLLTLVLASAVMAPPSLASDLYMKIDGNEFGQGVFRQRGRDCLIIAPTHVVENALQIEVTTAAREHYPASVLESFPGDISILRPGNEEGLVCRPSNWSGKINLNGLLEREKQGELRTMLADGSIRITDVDIIAYDKYRNINVRPHNREDAITKGASGSPLYIDGQFAGILLSVTNEIGNVIRLDALANTLSLFFGDTLPVGKSNMVPAASPKRTAEVSAEKPMAKAEEFSGTIAQSAVTVHSLKLEENSPIRIQFAATGDDEKFSFEIWDSSRRVVYRNPSQQYGGSESFTIPFTPPRNDTYSFHLTGTKGEGRYRFTTSAITADAQLRGEANVLQLGGNAGAGIIAQGAVAQYRIALEENSPVRLSFSATGDQGKYRVELVNATGKIVYRNPARQYSGTEAFTLPFTPPASDTYAVHIIGTEGESRYKVKVGLLSLDAHLRGEANVLQIGDPAVEGVVAPGAVAEYRLKVDANNPVQLNLSATGDQGTYKVEILDSSGKAVYFDPYRRYRGTEAATIPFATLKTDLYLVRLTGTEGECRYQLHCTQPAGK